MFNIKLIVILLVTFLNIILALAVYIKDPKNSGNKIFAFLSLSVGLWSFTNIAVHLISSIDWMIIWCQISYLSAIFIAASFVAFTFLFPKDSITKNKIWLIFFYIIIGMVVIFYPGFIIKTVIPRPWKTAIITNNGIYLFAIIFIMPMVLGYIRLWRKYRQAEGIVKRQIFYILVGTLITFVLGTFYNLILPLFNNYNYVWLGPCFSLIMVSFIAYAITRYCFMDIRFFIRKYMVTVFSLSLIIFIGLIAREVLKMFIIETIYADIIIFAAGLISYLPLKELFYQLANKYLFSSLYNPELLVREIGNNLWHYSDMASLGDDLFNKFKNNYHISSLAILGCGGKNQIEILYNNGFKNLDKKELNEVNLRSIFRRGTKTGAIIKEEYIFKNYLNTKKEDEVDFLQMAEFAVITPLVDSEKIIGFLLLDQKISGDLFNSEDILVLDKATSSIASALISIKRSEEHRRKIEEMRKFVEKLK